MSSQTSPDVLVIGAEDYAGRHIAEALSTDGYSVVALSPTEVSIPGVEWREFDPLSYRSIGDADLAGKTVVNAAEIRKDGHAPTGDFVLNYRGATQLADAVKDGRLIHISSSSIYSSSAPYGAVKEEAYGFYRANTLNTYSHSKNLAEHLLSEKVRSEAQIVSLRPHLLYGRGGGFLEELAGRVSWNRKRSRGKLFLPGEGKSQHTLTHIDNLVEAVKKTLSFSFTDKFVAFNIADSSAVSLQTAVAEYIRTTVNPTELKIYGPNVEFLTRLAERFPNRFSKYEAVMLGWGRTFDTSKAENLLGLTLKPFTLP